MKRNIDFTSGSITKNLLWFSLPLMVGNLLQQFYNIADTFIVGRYLGTQALAAVGSAYTLMIFLTSIILGLCMGSGAFLSMQFGKKDFDRLKTGSFLSFVLILLITLTVNVCVFVYIDKIILFLRVPVEIRSLMKEYLIYIFAGIAGVFLYNFFANNLRAIGNSIAPLIFLGIASVVNVILDLIFVLYCGMGVKGAAVATTISQYISGIGIMVYYIIRCPELRPHKKHMIFEKRIIKELAALSTLTALQQSIMNFGILMIQGLVNSFGTSVMAAFAAAVKIDTFAYSPVQDFGNAFSTYIAQNYGAGNKKRISDGIKSAAVSVFIFCVVISAIVCVFAKPLMSVFVEKGSLEIISTGANYLRIEGTFYFGIGFLFLLYGFYRAIQLPHMSVVLTVISLGTRVLLAYMLSSIPFIGVKGIWISVPIGWILADIVGYTVIKKKQLIACDKYN